MGCSSRSGHRRPHRSSRVVGLFAALSVVCAVDIGSAQLCSDRVADAGGILAAPRCDNLGIGMDGERTAWYPSGQRHHRSVYRDAKRNGPSTWWYADGTVAMRGDYRDDRRHGAWTLFDPAGRRTDAGTYDNGRPTGIWKRWRAGEALESVRYVDGIAIGSCPSGTESVIVGHDELWRRKHDEPAPTDRHWGSIAHCTDDGGARHGPLVDRAADGRVRIRGAYHAGARHGPWRLWRAPDCWDDQLWVNGKRHGQWQSWRHGILVGEYQYDRGVRAGAQKEWFDNGQLAFEVRYRDGEPQGPIQTWHDNGQLALLGAFAGGRRDGVWVAWSPSGLMRRRGQYRDGERASAWGYWYDSGNLYLSGRYDGGRKHGL